MAVNMIRSDVYGRVYVRMLKSSTSGSTLTCHHVLVGFPKKTFLDPGEQISRQLNSKQFHT